MGFKSRGWRTSSQTLYNNALCNNDALSSMEVHSNPNNISTDNDWDRLDLIHCSIHDRHLNLLANVLPMRETLECLDSGYNPGITLVSEHSFTNALACSGTLCHLYLSGCNIGDKGANSVADVLNVNVNKTILVINLNDNKISSRGGEFLAAALEVNETLEVMHLGNNMKGGATALGIRFVRVLHIAW